MPDENVLNVWSRSAQYWEQHRETIRAMFTPITLALIQDAEITPGQTVLDVATGPGEPALSIAEVVGSSGRVVGIDPVAEMIAGAERAARQSEKKNIRFEVASADSLPFANDTFDAAACRFGVMFFRSPADGIREMLRVLKPKAKLAFAVWGAEDRNPFGYVLSRVVERYVPEPPPALDSPDAFRFAAPGKLLSILKEAGAAAPAERLLEFRIEAPLSLSEFWAVRSQMSDKLRTKLAGLTKEQLAAVRDEVLQNLGPYATERGVAFPAEVLIVSGQKE